MKKLLLDYLGVALAGSQTESGKIARRFAKEHGAKPQARLIGDNARVDITAASFANAISSHSIELDDIDVLALFHFSPPVYSAGFGGCGVRGRRRQAAAHRARGRLRDDGAGEQGDQSFAAQSRLSHDADVRRVRRDRRRRESSCGCRRTSSCRRSGSRARRFRGLMEMYGPSMQKRFNPGPAARNGVTAARMAQLGFTGADTIFEGERALPEGVQRQDAARAPGDRTWRAVRAAHRVQAVFVRAPDPQRDRLRAGRPQAARVRCERRGGHLRRSPSGLGALPPEQDAADLPRGAGLAAVLGRGRADRRQGAARSSTATATSATPR